LDGCLALRCPRAAHNRLEHEAAFVDQDDVPASVVRLFLASGQSSVRQCSIAASSRSRARRSGFWQLHPMSRRMYHT
jgi:hypothetical protein